MENAQIYLMTQIIIILSWIMIGLGVFKMVIWLIGEIFPGTYSKIKSEGIRKFMTGTANRLLFGVGGFLTAGLGVGAIALAHFIRRMAGIG